MNILVYSCDQLNELKIAIKTLDYLQKLFEIQFYIVDNCSEDGTLEWLQDQPESLRAIELEMPIVVPRAQIEVLDINPQKEETEVDNENDHIVLKNKWKMNYFNFEPNHLIIDAIREHWKMDANILEVGCDNAATLIGILNELPDTNVYGVEINTVAANVANHFVEVFQGDIEEEFPYDDIKFDFIIFGDVLEHLSDPERILRVCKDHLSEDGKIVASIPNIMHISVVANLLKGNFEYADFGLLDRTHIHFFTYNEIIKMFNKVGLINIEITSIVDSEVSEKNREIIDGLLLIEKSVPRIMYESLEYLVVAGTK